MPYWKDAPSVKPEVFLSLSAPFRLLRADHYRLGRECRDNEEDDAGCGERDNTHDRCGDDGDKSRDNGREERERERDSFAHSVKDAEPHTLVWIRALRLEHLKKHSHLSDPDGGELLLKICGRQPSRRDSRARFLAALVPKYRPRARLVLLFLLPRVLPG